MNTGDERLLLYAVGFNGLKRFHSVATFYDIDDARAFVDRTNDFLAAHPHKQHVKLYISRVMF